MWQEKLNSVAQTAQMPQVETSFGTVAGINTLKCFWKPPVCECWTKKKKKKKKASSPTLNLDHLEAISKQDNYQRFYLLIFDERWKWHCHGKRWAVLIPEGKFGYWVISGVFMLLQENYCSSVFLFIL